MINTILVVDDYLDIRGMIRDILELEEYTVFEAADGAAALSVLEKEQIDCVITDILMPGIKGSELALKIKDLNPGVKLLAMSGGRSGSSDINQDTFFDESVFDFVLKKPFRSNQLLDLLQGFS